MKDSFILYNSFYEPIKALKNEQLGKLLRAIFDYTIDGNITQDNEILVAFMFIKNQIDIDSKKWQEEKNKRSEAGKKGMQNRWHNKDNNVITVNNKNNSVINDITKITDNVNVNENDNVNVIKEKINKKEKYGEFQNVLLTKEEYDKLEKSNLLAYIETLSSYIASKGKRYKSHYATILNWSRKEGNNRKEPIPSWFDKEIEKEEATKEEQDEIERLLGEFK